MEENKIELSETTTNIINDTINEVIDKIDEAPAEDSAVEPINKEELVKQYQKALITAINSVKDDISMADVIRENDEEINSYHSTKKILNNLQRKINKLEPLDLKDYNFLSLVCLFNAEKMTNYGQAILEQAQVVADLAKIFVA